jgi:hypothetical protein
VCRRVSGTGAPKSRVSRSKALPSQDDPNAVRSRHRPDRGGCCRKARAMATLHSKPAKSAAIQGMSVHVVPSCPGLRQADRRAARRIPPAPRGNAGIPRAPGARTFDWLRRRGKELDLLRTGAIARFDCYDVAPGAIEAARGMAAKQGVADQLRFHLADAFVAVALVHHRACIEDFCGFQRSSRASSAVRCKVALPLSY